MTRKERPALPDRRAAWQIEQGKKCGCGGTDDMCPCQNVCPWPSAPAPDWQARAEAAEAALAAFAAAVKELDRVSRDISAGYSDAAPCAIIVDLATGVEAWATIGAFRALSAAFSAYAPVQEPLPINLEKN